MRKVHHIGTHVLPMPEGHHMKKVLYRQLKRARMEVTMRSSSTSAMATSAVFTRLLICWNSTK